MEIVIRASIIFWLLWVLLRAGGKRELAEITPFELIVLVVMGDLIQQGVTEEDMSVTGAALAVTTMMLWTLSLSYLGYRSKRAARVLDSPPSIVIHHGRIDERMLRLQRLTVDELLEEARNHGIRSVDQIEYGVLEPDGKFSFVQRAGLPGPDQPDDDRKAG